VLSSGYRYTTANYFSKSWKKLGCGTAHLNTIESVNKNLSTISNIGTGEDYYGPNQTFWQISKTVLTSTTGISCTYVGHPNNMVKYPAFGVDKAIAILATSVSSSSSSGTVDE